MARSVLIVDDSMMVRQQVGSTLTRAGFAVVQAQNGVEALEKLVEHPDVSLVVCDLNMPKMSGIEFLENVHAVPSLRHLSVVMLTTVGNRELVQRATALGAKGWILKPFKAELLIAAVEKLTAAAA